MPDFEIDTSKKSFSNVLFRSSRTFYFDDEDGIVEIETDDDQRDKAEPPLPLPSFLNS